MNTKVVVGFVCLFSSWSSIASEQELDERSAPAQFASINETSTPDIVEIERVAERGGANAQYELGMRYFRGNGIAPDATKAARWLRKAAEAGHARSALQLGLMYRDGRGVVRDSDTARRWLQVAVAGGLSEAGQAISAMNYADALSDFEGLRAKAIRGDAQAQYQTGLRLLRGNGPVPVDAPEAFNWLRRAAEQGHADAEYELGVMYRDGSGVERNINNARQLFTRAAGSGLLKARVALQDLERSQQGTIVNPVAAFRDSARMPFYQAAKAGNADAQYELGLMYFNGDAGSRDYQQGLFWLRKAAEQNNVNAQMFLAEQFVRGTEIDGNYAEAAGWYGRAARLGNANAQYQLANLFRLGLGVKSSLEAANYWYTEAARQGHPKAKQQLTDAIVSAR